MFAPAATLALQTKPVQQPQRTTQPTSDLVIALAKLTLQHEQERQNRAQSENVVLQASASQPMMQRLEAMVEMYDQEGKTARANQGDQYVGHTPRGSLQVGRKCTGEPAGHPATLTDGRNGRSSSETGTQGGRTSSAEQRLKGSSLLPIQIQGRSWAGHRSVDFCSFSTATTNRGLVDSSRSQDTGTSTGSPTGRLCSQNQGGQTGATTGLWDSTHQHQEPEENPQTQGPDRGRGRRGGLITHYFVRRGGN